MTKTTSTNLAPRTERSDRLARISIVGATVALAVSVTSLLGTEASADGGFGPSACIQATSDGGKFVGKSGGCRTTPDSGVTPEPTTPAASCDATDDRVAGELAALQTKVALLDDHKNDFQTVLSTAVAKQVTIYGQGSATAGDTTVTEFHFTLDEDAAITALCAADGDPLDAISFKMESTTPVSYMNILHSTLTLGDYAQRGATGVHSANLPDLGTPGQAIATGVVNMVSPTVHEYVEALIDGVAS